MRDSDSELESTFANKLKKYSHSEVAMSVQPAKTPGVSAPCDLFGFEGIAHVTCDCCSQIDIAQLVVTQSLLGCTLRLIVNLTMMTSM